MSHEELLFIKGLIIGSALIGYKVAIFRAIHKRNLFEANHKKHLKDNKKEEK